MKVIYLTILLLVIGNIQGQSDSKKIVTFSFDQVDRGWEKKETVKERIAMLQLPDDFLKNASTGELLKVSLTFPYLTDVLFCDDYQTGLDNLINEFNGFQELIKRDDAISALLTEYKNTAKNLANIQEKSDIEKGHFSFRHFVLELFLTQDFVLNKVDKNQEIELFNLAFENKKLKAETPEIFSNLNMIPTHYLYAKKIITESNYKFNNIETKKSISNFIDNPLSIEQETIDSIENYFILKYK